MGGAVSNIFARRDRLELNAGSNSRDDSGVRRSRIWIYHLQIECEPESFAQCDLVIHLDTLPIIDQIRQQGSKFVADSDVVPADSEGVVFVAAELTLSTDAKAQCPLDWIRIAIGDSGVSEQSPAP